MFILSFNNVKANHEVDEAAQEQRVFLEKYITAGIFIAAGAKIPRTGGIIVAQGVARAEIDAIVAAAPFVQRGFATVEVTEFKAVFVAAGVRIFPMEQT